MSINQDLWKKILASGAQRVVDAQDELTAIDSRFGDADHGITMTKIAKAVLEVINNDNSDSIHTLMDDIASSVLFINGGSAASLWATLLEGMVKYAPDSSSMTEEDIKAMFTGALEALREITTADIGDKTMMDALIPAVGAMNTAQGNYLEVLQAASDAATEGAANSANFVSKFGRAKSYKEQTIGTPDAGAESTKFFFIGLYEGAQ